MLCFIVHSPGAPASAGLEEEPPLSPPPPPPRDGAYAAVSSQHLARRYAALAAEDCAAAARRFLLSSAAAAAAAASSPASCCKELGLAAAAAWEQQGRSLFVASMGPLRFLGPPAAVQLFQGLPPQTEHPLAPDLVCNWKDDELPDYTYCSQPRCGGGGSGGGGGGAAGGDAPAAQALAPADPGWQPPGVAEEALRWRASPCPAACKRSQAEEKE